MVRWIQTAVSSESLKAKDIRNFVGIGTVLHCWLKLSFAVVLAACHALVTVSVKQGIKLVNGPVV